MHTNALYTDLSHYYDLLCADIDYEAQSHAVHRLNGLLGNSGKTHLDLACGTGPHVRHFLDAGYESSGLDLHQPMLDLAAARCPQARFSRQDMCSFGVDAPLDLVTCFLYSLHYSGNIQKLKECLCCVHKALKRGGLFCFNAVDKHRIDNALFTRHSLAHDKAFFTFSSGWYYPGTGDRQSLKLSIERRVSGDGSATESQIWHEEHAMVAVGFDELLELLQPEFEVHVFEHDYDRIRPWDGKSGNALVGCVKI